MLCVKFGWNWFGGCRDEAVNVQKFTTDWLRTTNYGRRRTKQIAIGNLSDSGDLNS